MKLVMISKYLGLLILITIWASLDTSITNLAAITSSLKTNSFLDILSVLRTLSPYIAFTILILFFSKQLIFKIKNKNLNFIVKILIFNFLIQVIGLFTHQEGTFLNNSHLVLQSFMTIALLVTQFNNDNSKNILIASIVIASLIFFWFSLIMMRWYFSEANEQANLYGGWPSAFNVIPGLTENVPRSSGIARTSLIIIIPLSLNLIIKKKIKIYYLLLYIFFLNMILLTQSRFVLLGCVLHICVAFLYIISLKLKIIITLKKIFLILLIPLICHSAIVALKTYSITINDNYKGDTKIIKNYTTKNLIKKYVRTIDNQSFTSRRFEDWQAILKKNSNVLFGNGVMGDRWIIQQSASNIFLYNYASSGIVGIFLFGVIMLRSFFICSKIILFDEKKINKNNYFLLAACYIQYFLMGRALIESSFAVFGVDFLIFFAAYFFTEQYCEKKNYKNNLTRKTDFTNLGL